MRKIRWAVCVFYVIGVFLSGIFAHELIHWHQNPTIENKQISFFSKERGVLAYLDTPDDYIYLAEGVGARREVPAYFALIVVWLIGGVSMLKYPEAFVYDKEF